MPTPEEAVAAYFRDHGAADDMASAQPAVALLTQVRDDFHLSRALVDALDDPTLRAYYEGAELRLGDALGALVIPTWDWVREPDEGSELTPIPWPEEGTDSFSRSPVGQPCPPLESFTSAHAVAEVQQMWRAAGEAIAQHRRMLHGAAMRPEAGPSSPMPAPGSPDEALVLYRRATAADPMLAERGRPMADAILGRATAGIAAVRMQAAVMRAELGFHTVGSWLGAPRGEAQYMGRLFAREVMAAEASARRNLDPGHPNDLAARAIGAIRDAPHLRPELAEAAHRHTDWGSPPHPLPADAPLADRLAHARQITTLPDGLTNWGGRVARDATWHHVMTEGSGTLDPERAERVIEQLDAGAELIATLRHRVESGAIPGGSVTTVDQMERELAGAIARLAGPGTGIGQDPTRPVEGMARFRTTTPNMPMAGQGGTPRHGQVYGGAVATVRDVLNRERELDSIEEVTLQKAWYHLQLVSNSTQGLEALTGTLPRTTADAAAAIEAHPHAGDVDRFWARMTALQSDLTALELARTHHDLGALGHALAGVPESPSTTALREVFGEQGMAENEAAARMALGRDLRDGIVANGDWVDTGPDGPDVRPQGGRAIFGTAWKKAAPAHLGSAATTEETQGRLGVFSDPVAPRANTPFPAPVPRPQPVVAAGPGATIDEELEMLRGRADATPGPGAAPDEGPGTSWGAPAAPSAQSSPAADVPPPASPPQGDTPPGHDTRHLRPATPPAGDTPPAGPQPGPPGPGDASPGPEPGPGPTQGPEPPSPGDFGGF